MLLEIYSDGGVLNNHQKENRKAYGTFLPLNGSKPRKFTFSSKITNNEAEYHTLIKALEYVKRTRKGKEFIIFIDSQLILKQLNGTWKCKNVKLKPLYTQANLLVEEIQNSKKTIVIAWVNNEYMKKILGH